MRVGRQGVDVVMGQIRFGPDDAASGFAADECTIHAVFGQRIVIRSWRTQDQFSRSSGAAKFLPEPQNDMAAALEETGLCLVRGNDEQKARLVDRLTRR